MGLREQLAADLKDAMLQRDEVGKRTIRSVIAAIKKAETTLDSSGNRVSLDDQDIMGIVVRQAKQRRESIVEFRKGNREDLVAEEEAELAVLQSYLPQQLSQQEIEVQASKIIKDVGATGPRDIGKVMKPLMAQLKGQADGGLVNQVVRELLAG
jgi:uncharacterized protein YqeY